MNIYMYVTHIWIRHVPHMNYSCHIHEWVMTRRCKATKRQCHIWMSHVTHMNESCRIFLSLSEHKQRCISLIPVTYSFYSAQKPFLLSKRAPYSFRKGTLKDHLRKPFFQSKEPLIHPFSYPKRSPLLRPSSCQKDSLKALPPIKAAPYSPFLLYKKEPLITSFLLSKRFP